MGKLYNFFGRQKRRLAHITEPSNNDYGNDVSDNYDNNFGTFDDFGVKNCQKVSQNMILMSKYKGHHGGKKGQQIRARPPPPLFRKCPKEIDFSYVRSTLTIIAPKRMHVLFFINFKWILAIAVFEGLLI